MNTPVPVPATMIASVQPALADLGAVRTGIGRGLISDRELLGVLESLVALQRQVNGTVSVAMAAAEARDAAMRTLGTPLEAVLTRSGQETARQVRNQVFQAGLLAGRPQLHEAAATGRITLGQAMAIGEVVDGLPPTLDEAQKQRAEALLLTAADRLPAERLRAMSDTILDQVAPEAKDSPEQRQANSEARDSRAQQRRCLRFGVPVDGSIDIHGSLPVVEGTRLRNLVERTAAREYRAAKDTADRTRLATTPDQRAADALLAIIDVAEHGAREPGSGIPPAAAQISVLIRESDLRDRANTAGLLADGTPIAAGQLRRLLCDAEILPVVLGGSSEILDLGRSRRLASPAQRHAVTLRDGHCAFPGCTTPIHRCELHHISPWQTGGPTHLDNLVSLCVRHHQLCEPAPPATDGNGYATPADQWTIRARPGARPESVPPNRLQTTGPHQLSSPPPGQLHALTLFDNQTCEPVMAAGASGRPRRPTPGQVPTAGYSGFCQAPSTGHRTSRPVHWTRSATHDP